MAFSLSDILSRIVALCAEAYDPMNKICPSCGAESPEKFRFCGFCAHPLDAPPNIPPSPEPSVGQRSSLRQVTVLFADLANFTRAAERVEPEEIYYTIRKTLELLSQPVHRLGGHIDRYVGDGFLATFGVPEAHEDDPDRALRAALEMQQAMVALRAEASQRVNWDAQLRIGIHTGPVIRGQLDTGPLVDTSVFGHVVNLANRLQNAARPGTVLVSESIYRRTRGGFNFSEAVRLNLKGIDKPVIGYEVIDRRAVSDPTRGLTGRSTPLVGRATEYDMMITSLQRLQVERLGVTILITGEAGIGKSRLVHEVLAPVVEHFNVVHTECSPTETGSYSLLKSVLAALVGISPDHTPEERKRRVAEALSLSANLVREIGPILSDILEANGNSGAAISDPKQEQRRIFGATRRLIAWMARRRTLVLVFDDLHWADSSSLEALSHIADLVLDAPLALVAVARTSACESLTQIFKRVDPAQPDSFLDVRLQSLSSVDSDSLLTMMLADVLIPLALKQSLLDRAVGNPLLIEEIVRMLLDQGVIYQADAGWAVRADWVQAVQKVPDTVNGLVLSRYDRLPPHLRRLLDVAAVFRRSFSLPELEAMTRVSEPELREHLAELEQADFFRRTSSMRLPLYSFRHPLMREAIYETILQAERRALHIEAANVIRHITSGYSQEAVELIAYHLELGKSPLANTYLMQAATRAADRYANQEAIDYYHRLQALDEDQKDVQQAVDVALGLGELLVRINQPDAAREQLERAREIASKPLLNDYRLGDICYQLGIINADQGFHDEAVTAFEQASAILKNAPEQCRTFTLSDIEREVGWVLCNQARFAEAKGRAERALGYALEQNNPGAVGSAHNLLSAVHYYMGHFQESVASAQQALTIRDQLRDIWGSASTQTNLGTLYYKLGQWTLAESYLRQAIFVQQEIGDHYTLGLSRNTLSLLFLESGRFDEALQLLDQALAALKAWQEPSALAFLLLLNRGLTRLRLSQIDQAMADLERSLASATQLKNDNFRTLALSLLAEAHLAKGSLAQSHELLQQAEALERSSPSLENQTEILRVQSHVWKAEKAWQRALDTNRQATALLNQLGDRHEYARRQVEWVEIQVAWNKADPCNKVDAACQDAVQEALKTFRELHAHVDIAHAEEVLTAIEELAPSDGFEPENRQPFVVVVNVRLHIPALHDGLWDQQASIADAFNSLAVALRKTGKAFGATTTTSNTGLAYVFSSGDTDQVDRLVLKSVQCALAALDTSVRVNTANRRQFNVEIPASIGITAGLWRSAAVEAEETAVFTSVSQIGRRAEALATLSPINQILLSGEITTSIRSVYDLDVIEHLHDHRVAAPVFRLGHAKSGSELTQKLPGSTSHLIGRAAELAALRSWIDEVKQEPYGRVCYIEAEAGMGKTRLQAEAIAYARPEIACLIGKCEPFRANISFWALINMLGSCEFVETDANQRLKTILGLQPPDSADDLLLRSLSPADLRQEIFGRLREFLLQETANGPVLMVIEDIHWLDLSSLDLLDFLLPATREAPISILLTARAEMAGPHRSLLSKAARVCGDRYLPIKFSGLEEADSLALVERLLEVQTLPGRLADMLRSYAGHPLSLEEAVRYLIESCHLWRSNDRWVMTDVGHEPSQKLPRTYQDLLLARLETLDNDTLHVLQAAAALGENTDRSVLNCVIPGPAVASRLSELVERGWLLPPESDNPLIYRFKHTLTRETIYATLLTSKKRILHQRAGEAIESLYPDALDENAEVLAYHFSRSSQRDKSANYQLRAAEKSAARQALAESLGFYQEANEAIKHSPHLETQLGPRLMLGLADVHLALGIPFSAIDVVSNLLNSSRFELSPYIRGAARQRLATALRKAGRLAEALEHFEAARDTMKSWIAGQPHLPMAAKDALDRELLTTELGLAQTLFELRENKHAVQQVDYILGLADRHQYPDLVAQALDLKGGIAYRLNNGETALHLVQDSLSIYQATGNRVGAAAAYANLGVLTASIHKPDEAMDYFALSLGIRESLGDTQGIAVTRNNLGQLLARQGQFAEAAKHFSDAVDGARRAGLFQLLAQSLSNLGYVLTLLGQTDDALPAFREAESLCVIHGFRNLLCETLWKRAVCGVECGDYASAETAAGEALQLGIELESQDLQSEARRVLSRVFRRKGQIAVSLEESAAAWQARQNDANPIIRARFAAEYGLALTANGQLSEARVFLREHVSTGYLYESKTYLAEIDGVLSDKEGGLA